MPERLYLNPTPVGKVTVRWTNTRPAVMPHIKDGANKPIPVIDAWDVYVNGRRTDYRVVKSRTGMTILDPAGRMVTCWHSGCTPGDLARLTANGAGRQRYDNNQTEGRST